MNLRRTKLASLLAAAALAGCQESPAEKVEEARQDVIEAEQELREEQAELKEAEQEARTQPDADGGPILTLPNPPAGEPAETPAGGASDPFAASGSPAASDSESVTAPAADAPAGETPAADAPMSDNPPNEGDPQSGT